MKNYKPILLTILVIFSFEMNAQLILGIELGASMDKISNRSPRYINKGETNEYTFNVISKDPVMQFGIFFHKPREGRLNCEKKLIYNHHELAYQVQKTNDQTSQTRSFKTVSVKTSRISLYYDFSYSLNNVDFLFGMVQHYNVSSGYQNHTDIEFKYSRKSLQLGAQAGMAFNAEKLRFSVQYQVDFGKYGSYLSVDNQNLKLQKIPGRLIFSMGFKIGKLVKI